MIRTTELCILQILYIWNTFFFGGLGREKKWSGDRTPLCGTIELHFTHCAQAPFTNARFIFFGCPRGGSVMQSLTSGIEPDSSYS